MKKANALAFVAALLASGSVVTYVVAHSSGESREQSIEIVARRFAYVPSELILKKGIPAVLELTSDDVLMGFDAPDLGVRADMLPGRITRIRFVPDKAGTFIFYCDVFCGGGHEEMQGIITVVD